jgi:hypothetical protein
LEAQPKFGKARADLSLEFLYREAVASQSPGLPQRQPWVTELNSQFNRIAVASNWRNPFRVDKDVHSLTQG